MRVTSARITAVIGVALIAGAGVMTAIDHVQGTRVGECSLPPRFAKATSNTPQILAIEAGPNIHSPTLELGRPACITIVGNPALLPQGTIPGNTAQSATPPSEGSPTGSNGSSAVVQAPLAAKAATSAGAAAVSDVDLALFIDGQETPAHHSAAAIPGAQTLEFELEPVSDAKSADAIRLRHILGGLLHGGSRPVKIGLGIPNSPRPIAEWVPPDQEPGAELRVYSPLAAGIAAAGFVLLLVAIFLGSRTSSLLRDGDANSPYSLSRAQMAFWLIATVFAFVFIWVLTHQYWNVVPASTFALLGISGATGLAARAIDNNPNLAAVGAPAAGAAAAPAPPVSKGFLTDIISDASGPQLHRIQVAIWTAVLGTIFVWNLLDQLVLTDFDANLMILLGIANGVYAGFKTQEA